MGTLSSMPTSKILNVKPPRAHPAQRRPGNTPIKAKPTGHQTPKLSMPAQQINKGCPRTKETLCPNWLRILSISTACARSTPKQRAPGRARVVHSALEIVCRIVSPWNSFSLKLCVTFSIGITGQNVERTLSQPLDETCCQIQRTCPFSGPIYSFFGPANLSSLPGEPPYLARQYNPYNLAR